MARSTSPDWSSEIALLQKLMPMASEVHIVAGDALLRRFTAASKKPGREQEAKVLAVRLIAEAMSALEDFGALCRAVRLRGDRGIMWHYRYYGTREDQASPQRVADIYKEIVKENFPWNYLRLPWPEEYFNNPDADDPNLIEGLSLVMGASAKWHQAKGFLKVYNRAKHGFTVLDGPGDSAYALAEVSQSGQAKWLRINKCTEWPPRAKMVIATCADGWRQLAGLVILLYEHSYDLNLKPDPSLFPPARG